MVEVIKQKEEATEPWLQARILEVKDKDKRPGFVPKWVRVDLVDRFLAEGWKIVDNSDKKINPPSTIIDGAPLDTTVRKRELVLMELPIARVKAREAYFKSLTDGALDASVNEFKKVANQGTGVGYGEVKVVKGGA